MKRPDEFELFHQRRKRIPLAEVKVSNTSNGRQLGLKSLDAHKRIKSNSSNIDAIVNRDIKNVSSGKNDSRILPKSSYLSTATQDLSDKAPSIQDVRFMNTRTDKVSSKSVASASIFDESGIFKRARAMYQSKEMITKRKSREVVFKDTNATESAIPLTRIGKFLSKAKPFSVPPKNFSTPIYSMPPLKLWQDKLQLSEPSARFKLFESLVDYDGLTAKSNMIIRNSLVSAKLSEVSLRQSSTSSILKSVDSSRCVTLIKTTKISPFLVAATDSEGEEILLMNPHETDLCPEQRICLREHHTHSFGKTQTKAYYEWHIV